MIPKFGNITNPTVNIIREIDTIAKMGFDFVEIGIEAPEGSPEILLRNKNHILNILKRYKVFAIAHTPWWIELGSEYKIVRESWFEEGKNMIETADALNIDTINFHAAVSGMHLRTETSKMEIMKNMIKSLGKLTKFGKDLGIQVMLENMPPGAGVAFWKDYNFIMSQVPNLKCHLDVGHAFVSPDSMKHVKKFIMSNETKLHHIHLSDNHGKSDEHLSLGSGSINFKQVAKVLKNINYNKTITFEVFAAHRHLVKESMEYFKKLWNKV